MSPTLEHGDIIFYKSASLDVEKLDTGSIVIISNPLNQKQLLIKRINGIRDRGIELIGDNEEHSRDSRHFGFININNIEGIAESYFAKQRN